MAETVHLFLKANNADIQGESTQTSGGRANSIECLFYNQAVKTARETGSGMATGRRQYEPIRIIKRIDKSSPLLQKALHTNAVIAGLFKFYRPNQSGDGTTEQFYSVEIKGGRLSALSQVVHDTFNPAEANLPPMEEVSMVFHDITWTYTQGGVTDTDTWDAPA
jgi:type VI secretion system secreted protein Hcp